MKELILIIGLPGSGKTTYVRSHFSDNSRYVVFDDANAIPALNSDTSAETSDFPNIVREMQVGRKSIVVCSIDFCRKEIFREALAALKKWNDDKSLGYNMRCLFFENSAEKCRRNTEREMNSRYKMIRKYESLYDPYEMRVPFCENVDLTIQDVDT